MDRAKQVVNIVAELNTTAGLAESKDIFRKGHFTCPATVALVDLISIKEFMSKAVDGRDRERKGKDIRLVIMMTERSKGKIYEVR